MEGQTLSHYRVLEKLGGGGMGVVYKALDTKLNRHVALKFLPPELTRDDDARERFMREAQAASALDHPNICTIHEIDSTPDGQLFIAMGYYEGETLKKRIERGPLPVEKALDIAVQMAQGLAEAHAADIVHRDIKPANVMITKSGLVKIVDFGIAKLLGVTGPTQTGTTLGTVSYMSPEQIAGEDADQQSDVWSLGAVLYEMLTGQPAFKGENQWAVMNAISNRDPDPPSSLSPEVPPEVQAVVLQALKKPKETRYVSASAFEAAARASQRTGSGSSSPRAAFSLRLAVPALVVAIALGIWGVVSVIQGGDAQHAREQLIPQILQLIDQDAYVEAFALAEEAEQHIPNDPTLVAAWEQIAIVSSIVTEPAGSDIYIKSYADANAGWELLGQSPVVSLRLPLGHAVQLRVEKAGYESRLLATGVPGFFFRTDETPVIDLLGVGQVPPDMVLVPGGDYRLRITGFNEGARANLAPFLVDRHEVTNAEFKEFVDAGGYAQSSYWDGLEVVKDGQRLSWEQAMAEFVDSSGRPGPAAWELGDYLDGQANYPVTGVSWYEAVAYNKFRDKELPTIYHWARAALPPHDNALPLAASMVPVSNFDGGGPAAVGSYASMGPYGTFDTAGNVKEWCWNASSDDRWIMGGADHRGGGKLDH